MGRQSANNILYKVAIGGGKGAKLISARGEMTTLEGDLDRRQKKMKKYIKLMRN
jgi:hypothetical protein